MADAIFVLFVPRFDVVKIRLQIRGEGGKGVTQGVKGVTGGAQQGSMMMHIVRSEGLRGLTYGDLHNGSIHANVCAHIYVRACMHTYITCPAITVGHTVICTMSLCMHMCAYMHACVHAYIHHMPCNHRMTYSDLCYVLMMHIVSLCMRMCACIYACVHTYAYLHTVHVWHNTHDFMYAYVDMHTYCTCIYACMHMHTWIW